MTNKKTLELQKQRQIYDFKFRAWIKQKNYTGSMIELDGDGWWGTQFANFRTSLQTSQAIIMQNTFQCDRNAEDIYEGDIIRHYDNRCYEEVYLVKWDHDKARFKPFCKNREIQSTDFFIIGNMYENPYLLKRCKNLNKSRGKI